MSTVHTEPAPQSPQFDLKSIVFITALVLGATGATLMLVGDIGPWSMHTQRALLVGGLVVALGGSTAGVITGQMWVAARRRVEEAGHEHDRHARSADLLTAIESGDASILAEIQAGRAEVADRVGRLSDDTSAELGEAMKVVREILAAQQQILTSQQAMLDESATRHQAILDGMKQVARDSLRVAMNPDAVANVVELSQRIGAGPVGTNGVHRPAN